MKSQCFDVLQTLIGGSVLKSSGLKQERSKGHGIPRMAVVDVPEDYGWLTYNYVGRGTLQDLLKFHDKATLPQ